MYQDLLFGEDVSRIRARCNADDDGRAWTVILRRDKDATKPYEDFDNKGMNSPCESLQDKAYERVALWFSELKSFSRARARNSFKETKYSGILMSYFKTDPLAIQNSFYGPFSNESLELNFQCMPTTCAALATQRKSSGSAWRP